MLSFGFPPIATTDARVLILGSLPGQQSLQASEYYAHPRNAFWKIMGVHLGSLPESYAARVLMVSEAKVALWDVLAAATRSGSLDADIEKDAVANNFRAFFHAYPGIRLICFNGAKAAALYDRFVVPGLSPEQRSIQRRTLPSTSPAHASESFEQKADRWAV